MRVNRRIFPGTPMDYFWDRRGLVCAGSLVTAQFIYLKDVWAGNRHVFQLEIHQAAPGKVPTLEEGVRSAPRLQAKHRLDVVRYCVPEDSPDLK